MVSNLVSKHRKGNMLTHREAITINELKKNHPILILLAANGKSTIITDTDIYSLKIHALLEDNQSYKLVLTNTLPTVINQAHKMLI